MTKLKLKPGRQAFVVAYEMPDGSLTCNEKVPDAPYLFNTRMEAESVARHLTRSDADAVARNLRPYRAEPWNVYRLTVDATHQSR